MEIITLVFFSPTFTVTDVWIMMVQQIRKTLLNKNIIFRTVL